MCLGDNHLPLLVNGVHIILMIEERLMYIFLWHDTRKEYHEKEDTKKFNNVLFHLSISMQR